MRLSRRGFLTGLAAVIVGGPALAAQVPHPHDDTAPLLLKDIAIRFDEPSRRPHGLQADLWLLFAEARHRAAARAKLSQLTSRVMLDLAGTPWAEIAGAGGISRVKELTARASGAVLGRPADEVLIARFLTF